MCGLVEDYNNYYDPIDAVTYRWNPGSFNWNLASFQGGTTHGDHSLYENPLFVDTVAAGGRDMRPGSSTLTATTGFGSVVAGYALHMGAFSNATGAPPAILPPLPLRKRAR
jgi:hypothetical protein